MIGTILDEKYRIDRLLGRGGMGSVYAAEDVRSGAQVAVKVISAQLPGHAPDIAARFEREARAVGAIDSEHIARCLDAGVDAATGQPYMVLELLAGEDFHRVLRRTGPIEPEVALRVAAQACLGLASAHDAGVIHRDIKPANLFLSQRGDAGERVLKLLDFGVAKIVKDPGEEANSDDALTRTGSMLGSPMYMSPEQARSVKHIDHRSDLWSLGVVLYQSLAGRTPFKHIAGIGDLVLALWSEPPPPVQQFAPWVPLEVAALLDRMLRVEPGERYQSAAEVLEAIRALLPDGMALDEAMLVPIPAESKSRAAQTFFRRIDTRRRPRSDAQPPRAQTESPQAAPVPAAPEPPATKELTGGSNPPGPPTQNGLVTTDPGVVSGATPPPQRRPAWITAVPVAAVGLLIGVGAVYVFVPTGGANPASSSVATITAAPLLPSVAAPTVEPAASPTSLPEPSASASPPASAPPPASASASATAGAHSAAPAAPSARASEPATARPKGSAAPSATPSASAAAQPTARPFTDFGDRK